MLNTVFIVVLVIRGTGIEANAAVRQSHEVRTVSRALAAFIFEDGLDDIGHALVGREFNWFKLGTEHPQPPLKQRLQLVDFIHTDLFELGAQFANQLQAVLDLVQHQFSHANGPLLQDVVKGVVVSRLALVQKVKQPVARLGLLQLGKNAGQLDDFVFTEIRAGINYFIDEAFNSVLAHRR